MELDVILMLHCSSILYFLFS